MNKKTRKAFTLVELLVVIAILAVLATVGIVGYTSFTKKAKESNDKSVISQLNLALQATEVTDGKPETMYEVLQVVEAAGFVVANLTPDTDGYDYVYDMKNNRFALLNGTTVVASSADKDFVDGVSAWVIAHNESEIAKHGRSTYIADDYQGSSTLNISTGLDLGNNDKISTINYSSSANQEVVIRTNSAYETLTINASTDVVKHFGSANVINVTAVAMSSYHENGSVATLNVKAGRIEVEADAFVGVVAVDKDATTSNVAVQNNGTIFATEVITYNATTMTHEVIENPTDEQKAVTNTISTTSAEDTINIGTADALINIASAQSQGIVTGSLKIELTKDIDLTGKTWIPFGADLTITEHYGFNGSIDGKNHTITGLSNGSYRGVQIANGTTGQIGEHYGFVANSGANLTISNLNFASVNIDSDTAVVCGAIVAYVAGSNLTLNNVKVEGKVTGADKVSGLVGYAKEGSTVNVTNCSVNAQLTAHEYRIGGYFGFIAAQATVSISNSSFSGNIVAENSGSKTATYVAAIGSIHSAAGTASLTVSNFTLNNAQVQSPAGLADNKKISSSNGTVLVAIMTGTATLEGVTGNVVSGQDFSISLVS